ncbi:MAG: DNA adenine methylase [Cyanobacteria bacterium SZAS LIN-5]|nr:DNA adenine methylase [Cyanobacteria bacterium SZAS LIN-5]
MQYIAAMFPDGIEEYREPMVGGGSVYLGAKSLNIAKRYWINDKYRDLTCFWKTVKNPQLCLRLQDDLHKLRSEFSSEEQIKAFYLESKDRRPQNDYESALLFFFFNRVSFSGTTQAGGFSAAASTLRFTTTSIQRLGPMAEALRNTKITTGDFRRLVEKSGEGVFLFLDPPYYTASRLYGKKGVLHEFPHEELSILLQSTPHRFLITYDDCEEIRRLYKWANFEVSLREWRLAYGMNNCSAARTCKVGNELFIYNYPTEANPRCRL